LEGCGGGVKQHHHKRSESKLLRFSSKRIGSAPLALVSGCVWIQRKTGTETNPPHLGGRKQGQCPTQAVSREDQIPIAGHRIEKASFSSRAAEFQIPPPEVTRATYISKGKEFMAAIWNHLQSFFLQGQK